MLFLRAPVAVATFLYQSGTVNGHEWLSQPVDGQTVDDDNLGSIMRRRRQPMGNLACLASSVNHSKIVVAAVGDSITVGATCNTWMGGYVKILQDILGEEKYDVRDCGVCGHDAVRAHHGNVKHATYWETSAHNNSKAMKPDVVIFMLGTNDADEWYNTSTYYSQDFKDLASEYIKLENKPKVVTLTPPPLSNFSCSATHNPTCLAPYDKACVIDCVLPKLVPKLTHELGLAPPVDMLTFFGGPTHTNKSAMPGLHPNCNGYTIMGEYIAKTLFGVGGVSTSIYV